MNKSISIAFVLIFALSLISEGAIVTKQFNGTVTTSSLNEGTGIGQIPEPGFQVGDIVHFSFSYDDALSDQSTGPFGKSYQQTSNPANFCVEDLTNAYQGGPGGPFTALHDKTFETDYLYVTDNGGDGFEFVGVLDDDNNSHPYFHYILLRQTFTIFCHFPWRSCQLSLLTTQVELWT